LIHEKINDISYKTLSHFSLNICITTLLAGKERIVPTHPSHLGGFGTSGKHGWGLLGKLDDFTGCVEDNDSPYDHYG